MSGACIGEVSHFFPWGNLQLAFGVGIREDRRADSSSIRGEFQHH